MKKQPKTDLLAKQLKTLIDKNFKVYDNNDNLECEVGFLGLLFYLHNHSDFFNWSTFEQREVIKEWFGHERIDVFKNGLHIEFYL